MGLNFKFPKVEITDTSLKDSSVPGIRLSEVRWSVDTAGPSPFDNIRTEIFFEGCKKAIEGNPCKGCFNSSTWIYGRNPLQDPRLVAKYVAEKSNGYVTIGGGDPLDQIDGLLVLVKELKKHNVNIIMYTWRSFESLLLGDKQGVLPHNKDSLYNIEVDFNSLLKYVDYIIDGEFIEDLKIIDYNSTSQRNRFVGSSNQYFYDVKNLTGYSLKYIKDISIDKDNNLIIEERL